MFMSDAVRNARANAIEATIGVSAKLKLYSGAAPADETAAATGTLLVNMALPSDYLTAGAAGAISKNGSWVGTGLAAGTVGYARITSSADVSHWQFTVSAPGGGGEAIMDNPVVALNQAVSAPTFTYTEAH